jgi:hypothetical protein
MRIGLYAIALLGLGATIAGADGASDLAGRLQALRSPGPVAATLRLELRLERTLHHTTVNGRASVRLDVEEDGRGTHVHWEPAVLREANEEERQHDASPDGLRPVREALKELDAVRLGHLLDQAPTVAGLTKGPPAEEDAESYEGHEARRLVYRFQPRLSWTDAYYLKHSEGRFAIWIAPDGTPIASESVASFEGKTSRMFGRFKGTTRITTRYAAEDGRLRVAERDVDEADSREDGGEAEHAVRRFVLERR